MKEIYQTSIHGYNEYFLTRKEAFENIIWEKLVNDRVAIYKYTLEKNDEGVDMICGWKCIDDTINLGDYSDWDAEEEVFIINGEKYSACEFFFDSDDEYSLRDGTPDFSFTEDENEELFSTILFNMEYLEEKEKNKK